MRTAHTRCRLRSLLVALLLAAGSSHAEPVETAEWTHTEGAPGGGRFSPLTDITRENVSDLRIAWSYEHEDFWEGRFPLNINGGTAAESVSAIFTRAGLKALRQRLRRNA